MEQNLKDSKVPALDKAFAILDMIGRVRQASLTDIITALDLPKSSTYYILETLVRLGALRCVEKNQYVLGLRLFELGTLSVRNRSIRQDALPFLQDLAESVGLICHLGTLEGNEAVYLAKVESHHHPLKVNSWEGKRISLHSSSLGKVLLAWKEQSVLEELLSNLPWTRSTPTTITDPTLYKAHLDQVRQQGWAADNGEDIPEISCFAAPIRDRSGAVIYAVSITGTTSQIQSKPTDFFIPPLLRCAERIARELGGLTPSHHTA